MMLREAGAFSEHLRQCEGEIRAIKDATESLLTTVRSVLSAPLPRTYDDAGGGAAAPSATRPRAIGGPDADLDGLREVGREAGRRLESEVLAPMGRWNQAYELVKGRMVKLEALRLEVDSRRRTVARLGKRVDAQRARGGSGRPLLLGGRGVSEADLESAIRVLQHKEAKLAACRVSFREHETLVFHQLVNLIRDAVWLKSYLSAVLQVQADTFERSNQALGALRAPALPAPGHDNAERNDTRRLTAHEDDDDDLGLDPYAQGRAPAARRAGARARAGAGAGLELDLGGMAADAAADLDSRDRERPRDDASYYYEDAPVPRSLALQLGGGAQGPRNVWSSWDPRPADDGTLDPPDAAPESPDGYAPAALYAPGGRGDADDAARGRARGGGRGGPLGRGPEDVDEDVDASQGYGYGYGGHQQQHYDDSQPSERGGRRAARNLDAEDAYGRGGRADAPAPRPAGARARGGGGYGVDAAAPPRGGGYAPDPVPSHGGGYGYDKRALASERSDELYAEPRIPAGRARAAGGGGGGARDARRADALRAKAYPTGHDVDEDVLYGSGLQAAYASGGGDYRSGRRGWD